MEVVYKRAQLSQLASKLGISKVQVSTVWELYVLTLQEEIAKGNTVKFFNICYISVEGKPLAETKTLAYIAHEIADELKLGKDVVFRILLSYEEYLIRDLRKSYYYSIRGLVGIRLVPRNGYYRVKVKKSKVYEGMDIRVMAMPSFKRKIEGRIPSKEDFLNSGFSEADEVLPVLDVDDFFME